MYYLSETLFGSHQSLKSQARNFEEKDKWFRRFRLQVVEKFEIDIGDGSPSAHNISAFVSTLSQTPN